MAEPSWQVGALECLLLGWVPACGTIISVHSIGKARAFWIGATIEAILPPVIYLAAFIGFDSPVFEDFLPSLGYFRVFLANLATHFRPVLALWAFAPIVGLLCVLTHWLLVRPPQGPQD